MARRGSPREQISAGLRFDILRRCNFACYYCGVPASMGVKQLHIDHVIPVALGGTNDPWNLVAACWDCNAGKAAMAPTPEIVRQVREDAYYYATARGGRMDQCSYCQIPLPLDQDEEPCSQCSNCFDARAEAFSDGHESGYNRAFDELDAELEKRRSV